MNYQGPGFEALAPKRRVSVCLASACLEFMNLSRFSHSLIFFQHYGLPNISVLFMIYKQPSAVMCPVTTTLLPTMLHSSSQLLHLRCPAFPSSTSIPTIWTRSSTRYLLLLILKLIAFQLKENSYYRMQQTCRGVGEFIRKSPNVSVHIDRAFSTRWDSKKSCYIFERYYGDLKRCDNIEALYGTNVSSIIDVGQFFSF